MVTLAEVSKLKVSELKDELNKLGLPLAGLKKTLAARLTEALEAAPEADDAEPNATEDAPSPAAPPDAADSPKQAAVTSNQENDQQPEADEAKDNVATVPSADPDAVADTDAAEQSPSRKAAAATAIEADADGASEKDANPTDSAPAAVVDAVETVAAQRSTSPAAAPTDRKPKASESAAADSENAPPEELPEPSAAQPAAQPVAQASPAASDGGPPAKMDAEAAMAANDTQVMPIAEAESQAAAETGPSEMEEGKSNPSASVAVEAGQGPEAMEDDDGAPEVDFEVDVEEEVAEAAKAANAVQGERKRKAASGDAREAIKAARLSGKGDSTPRSGRFGGMTPRIGVRIPSPNREATKALRIDGLMRPFTKSQLEDVLSQEGCQLEELWLPTLKTHCYALFQSSDNAETIRQATFGVQWPKGSQKRLTAEFVDEEEAVSHINGTYLTKPVADTSEPATVARSSQGVAARLSVGNQEKAPVDARQEIMDRRNQRQADTVKKPARDPVPELGLDDLFRKTSTEPPLYWLPSSEAAEKPQDAAPSSAAPPPATDGTS